MIDVKWVKFKDREGPVIHGNIEYECPLNASNDQKTLFIVSKCEGAKIDSVNMYDRGVISVGLLQWAEHVGKVSRFFGYCIDNGLRDDLAAVFQPMFDKTDVGLAPYIEGTSTTKVTRRWHFTYMKVPVVTPGGLQDVFYGCDGLSSSWTDEKRSMAIEWAQTFHSALRLTEACMETYACRDMHTFITPSTKLTLFTGPAVSNMHLAARALIVAMAINNPLGAQRSVALASQDGTLKVGYDDWCIRLFEILKRPTGEIPPQFAARYTRVKNVVEGMYNVQLP